MSAKITAARTWRDLFPVHPAADAFPMMTGGELADQIVAALEAVERPVAEIRIRDQPRRVFVATTCRIEAPFVHAEGRWRWRIGLNYADVRWSGRRSYTWSGSIVQIRWLDVAVEALAA